MNTSFPPFDKNSKFHHILRWITPNGGTLLLFLLFILTQNVWARSGQEASSISTSAIGSNATTISWQGRLTDEQGNPLNSNVNLTFALFDVPTGGSTVWGPENHNEVLVSDGVFNLGLGSQTPGGFSVGNWNTDLYLEITVNGETLSPRELIRSVPIAGMALTVPAGAITQAQAPTLLKTSDENQRMETGSITLDLQPGWQGNIAQTTFTFPFGSKPIVTIANVGDSAADQALNIAVAVTANGMVWNAWSAHSSGVRSVTVNWIAVGD